MKEIINGKLYDTETATKICDVSYRNHTGRSDFSYDDTDLYVTAKGAYFIAGEGGARSRWATSVENGSTGGSGIRVVSHEEAKEMAESRLNLADYAKFFGEVEAA